MDVRKKDKQAKGNRKKKKDRDWKEIKKGGKEERRPKRNRNKEALHLK